LTARRRRRDDEIAAEAADMAAGTDELMASMTDDIAAALAEAQETPEESGFVPTTAPQPETLVSGRGRQGRCGRRTAR
jgi:hypothetical protein